MVINGEHTPVFPLSNPEKTVVVSNVPPFTEESELSMDTKDESDGEFVFRTPIKRKVTGVQSERPTGGLGERLSSSTGRQSMRAMASLCSVCPRKRSLPLGVGVSQQSLAHGTRMTFRWLHRALWWACSGGRNGSRDVQGTSTCGSVQVMGPAYSRERIRSFSGSQRGKGL